MKGLSIQPWLNLMKSQIMDVFIVTLYLIGFQLLWSPQTGGRVLDVNTASLPTSLPTATMLTVDSTPTTQEPILQTSLTTPPSVVATPLDDVTQPTTQLDSTTVASESSTITRDIPFMPLQESSRDETGIPFILGKGIAARIHPETVTFIPHGMLYVT